MVYLDVKSLSQYDKVVSGDVEALNLALAKSSGTRR